MSLRRAWSLTAAEDAVASGDKHGSQPMQIL